MIQSTEESASLKEAPFSQCGAPSPKPTIGMALNGGRGKSRGTVPPSASMHPGERGGARRIAPRGTLALHDLMGSDNEGTPFTYFFVFGLFHRKCHALSEFIGDSENAFEAT